MTCLAILRLSVAGLATLLLGAACGSVLQVPGTAQRPSFATDSVTTPAGTLELEAGLLVDPHDEAESPLTLKWGADEHTEVFVQRSPLRHERTAAGTVRGRSDVLLGVRRRERDADLVRGRGLALGWQAVLSVPLGATGGFSSGEYDLTLSAIIDVPRPGWALTGYLEASSLGEPDGGGRDGRVAASIVGGVPLSDSWQAFAELAGQWTPERNEGPALAQLGLAWTADPRWIWDLAVESGLNADAGGTLVHVGLTVNLGAPWGRG